MQIRKLVTIVEGNPAGGGQGHQARHRAKPPPSRLSKTPLPISTWKTSLNS